MGCQIIYSKSGSVKSVLNPEGLESKLYKDLLEKYKDENLALDLWALAYTEEYGGFKNEPSLIELEYFLNKTKAINTQNSNESNIDGSDLSINTKSKAIQAYIQNEDGSLEPTGMYLPDLDKRKSNLIESKNRFISNYNEQIKNVLDPKLISRP